MELSRDIQTLSEILDRLTTLDRVAETILTGREKLSRALDHAPMGAAARYMEMRVQHDDAYQKCNKLRANLRLKLVQVINDVE